MEWIRRPLVLLLAPSCSGPRHWGSRDPGINKPGGKPQTRVLWAALQGGKLTVAAVRLPDPGPFPAPISADQRGPVVSGTHENIPLHRRSVGFFDWAGVKKVSAGLGFTSSAHPRPPGSNLPLCLPAPTDPSAPPAPPRRPALETRRSLSAGWTLHWEAGCGRGVSQPLAARTRVRLGWKGAGLGAGVEGLTCASLKFVRRAPSDLL